MSENYWDLDSRTIELKSKLAIADRWREKYYDKVSELVAVETALKDARETIAEVIRNSHDVIAKKLCSKTLERIDPVIGNLTK